MEHRAAVCRIQLLGTGAADHDWARIGEPGVRGSAGTLFNGAVLIDYGATGPENLARFGVAPDRLEALIFTHTHSDHFAPEKVRELLEARRNPAPLQIYGSREMAGILSGAPNCVLHPLSAGTVFRAKDLEFTALPSNHMLEANPEELTFHYLIRGDAGTVLYALDGAWLTKPEWLLIRGIRLNLILIDATMAEGGDWRIFEHNDLDMIEHMLLTFRREGMVSDATRVVLTHMARTLWPEESAAARALAERRGFELGYDGMMLELVREYPAAGSVC